MAPYYATPAALYKLEDLAGGNAARLPFVGSLRWLWRISRSVFADITCSPPAKHSRHR